MNGIRRRDPEATRGSILAAAEALFVRDGYGMTSLADIAAQAQVNKSLILHYFGSKLSLWDAVKERAFADFIQAQQKLYQSGPGSVDELRDTVSGYFRLLQSNPNLVMLMQRAEMEQDLACSQYDEQRLDLFHRRLQQMQTDGVIRPGVDTAHLLLLLICVCTQWFEAREIFKGWPALCADQDPDSSPDSSPDSTLDSAFLDSVLDIVLRGIGAVPDESSAPASQAESPS